MQVFHYSQYLVLAVYYINFKGYASLVLDLTQYWKEYLGIFHIFNNLLIGSLLVEMLK